MKHSLPKANGICAECQNRIEREGEGIFIVCNHNQAGAFMMTNEAGVPLGIWMLMTPVEESIFRKTVPMLLKLFAMKGILVAPEENVH